MLEDSREKFAAVEGQLAKLDEEAVKARELHEQEMAEAAAKPSDCGSLVREHIGVLKAQVQEQMDALQNELKNDGSRQHEEIIANVRATIEEQSAMLVTTCLDELGKLLESIGAQQQAEILSAMRVTIQEQVTFNISYYLDELTKMFDAHGVRSLRRRSKRQGHAREQVPYNTEGHLTDFCKNLAPEMLQLFQEIKEKAEEKSRLDRQIDILRRHKHDYEAGDLRTSPQQIHVTRSDADLIRPGGEKTTRRDEPTEIPYSQTGSRSHHSIYPDQWSRE
ncbi:hypothetical protein BC629DRAFT_1503560 [Irpex lacteus]|nr:hypothetical protein BC629DRAFT_1503560 [Irpex lacteus]